MKIGVADSTAYDSYVHILWSCLSVIKNPKIDETEQKKNETPRSKRRESNEPKSVSVRREDPRWISRSPACCFPLCLHYSHFWWFFLYLSLSLFVLYALSWSAFTLLLFMWNTYIYLYRESWKRNACVCVMK